MSTLRDTGPPRVENWPPRACDGADTRIFFPGKDGGGRTPGLEAVAKRMCQRCRARPECKAYSVPIVDLAGVWAGLTENERLRIRRAAAGEEPRGRPRVRKKQQKEQLE